MLRVKKLIYLTYQSFPANTANSLQTISNIRYLVRNNIEVELVFPLREKSSDSNIDKIKKHYAIDENFKITGLKHFLPFGRTTFLRGLFFHISQFLWAYFVVRFKFSKMKETTFMTRSDWILFFLAKYKKNVIFECHQTSKTRTFVLNKVGNYENVKIIFLNHNLQQYYKMNENNSTVLHNGVDPDVFKNFDEQKQDKKEIVFIGNLKRFNEERGINFIIDAYKNSEFLQKNNLTIVGGPQKEAEKLFNKINDLGLSGSLKITGRLDRSAISNIYQNSKIGILINSSNNIHSYEFTSPLKYFEYLYTGLIVVGVDFPSHRALPRSDEIIFFEENNLISFELAIKKALNLSLGDLKSDETITLEYRAKKIINLID